MIFLKIWRSRMVRAFRSFQNEMNGGLVFTILYNHFWKADTYRFSLERYKIELSKLCKRSQGLDTYFAIDQGLQWEKRFRLKINSL